MVNYYTPQFLASALLVAGKIKGYLSLKMNLITESNIYINVIIIYVNILNLGWVKIKEIYVC